MDGDVQVVYRSLGPEMAASHQRSVTELEMQGNYLILRIYSEDLVSMRAAFNGWLRLIRIAVEMNATIES
jgi:KEOPS complex subunit Pcc1